MVLLPQIIQQFASREFALFLCTLTSCRRQNVRNERSAGWPIRCLGRAFYRTEEHTSELQSLMRISYAVFCLKKKTKSEQTKTPQPMQPSQCQKVTIKTSTTNNST